MRRKNKQVQQIMPTSASSMYYILETISFLVLKCQTSIPKIDLSNMKASKLRTKQETTMCSRLKIKIRKKCNMGKPHFLLLASKVQKIFQKTVIFEVIMQLKKTSYLHYILHYFAIFSLLYCVHCTSTKSPSCYGYATYLNL